MTRDEIEKQLTSSRTMISELSTMATHPEFVKLIQEIEELPESQQEAAARRLATIDELTRRGIPIPDQARISLRRFEDPSKAYRQEELVGTLEPQRGDVIIAPGVDEEAPTVCLSLGFFACFSVGDIASPSGGGSEDSPDDDPVGAGTGTGDDEEGTGG